MRRSGNASGGGLDHCVIDRARAVGEAGDDVFVREIRKVGDEFVDGCAGRQRVEDVGDAHPRAGDDRAAAADVRVDGDAFRHGCDLRVGPGFVKLGVVAGPMNGMTKKRGPGSKPGMTSVGRWGLRRRGLPIV